MTTCDDFLSIECSPDLIQAGTASVSRALVKSVEFASESKFDRLRQGVVNRAVELAFRRYLGEKQIPHQLVEPASFSGADAMDVSFGGRRAVVFGQLVSQRGTIRQVQKAPELLTRSAAYLPGENPPGGYQDADLYIFAALTGLVTRSHEEIQKALVAGQPLWMVHPMPAEWARPEGWGPLGELLVKGDISEAIELTLHGLEEGRGYVSRRVTLAPRERVSAGDGFYALNALHTESLPDGPVGVHSPGLGETLLVSSYQWGNIWVYGIRMYFLGYISQGDYNRQAKKLPAGKLETFDRCGERELVGVPVGALRPLSDLFSRAASWARQQEKK